MEGVFKSCLGQAKCSKLWGGGGGMAHLASPPPPYQPHVYAQVAVMASVVVCLLTAAGVTKAVIQMETAAVTTMKHVVC